MYVTFIRETALAHSSLKRIFNDGKDELSPEFTKRCNEYFAKNDSKLSPKTSRTDFINQEISQSELKQAEIVAKTYMVKVAFLLKSIEQQSK